MKRIDDDNYELSTGRQFYAHAGIIGIASDDAEPPTGQLSHGWDGAIDVKNDLYPEDDWTLDERREFGEFMIALWTEWTQKQK
jgi:hypothetical protein